VFKINKKKFISALTLVCLLGWSTALSTTVANAAPMQKNPQRGPGFQTQAPGSQAPGFQTQAPGFQTSGFQTPMEGQSILNIFLQFYIPDRQNGQQNGLFLRLEDEQQNKGLPPEQQLGPQNGRQDRQQPFFNIISLVADVLDVDEQTIIDELQAGSTLVEIAESYDISESDLLAELEDRIEDAIDDALTVGIITKTQADEMKSKLAESLTQALERRFSNLKASLPAPDDLTATAEGSDEIFLDWDSVSGATSYYVYRATSSSGTYTKIATVSTSSYTDSGLKAGKTYYYKVKAHNSTGTSDYSSVAYATTDED